MRGVIGLPDDGGALRMQGCSEAPSDRGDRHHYGAPVKSGVVQSVLSGLSELPQVLKTTLGCFDECSGDVFACTRWTPRN